MGRVSQPVRAQSSGSRPVTRLPHPRFLISEGWRVTIAWVVGSLVSMAAEGWRDPQRSIGDALIIYILFAIGAFTTYAVLTWFYYHRLDRAQLVRAAALTRPKRRWVNLLMGAGRASDWGGVITVLSLGAVIAVAVTPSLRKSVVLLLMCVGLVVSGWLMMLYVYAMHYLRSDIASGGLNFPGDEAPVFSDYVYFSQQIQTTFGGSDVSIEPTALRRAVNTHNLFSYAFSTVVVALLVSAILGASPS